MSRNILEKLTSANLDTCYLNTESYDLKAYINFSVYVDAELLSIGWYQNFALPRAQDEFEILVPNNQFNPINKNKHFFKFILSPN